MAVSTNTTVITNAGESAAITAGNNGATITITSFQIGSDLITPSALDTGVSTPVFIGSANQITYSANVSTNSMVFLITLDETVGNFTVGNIGLFLSDGTMFTITALAVAESKTATNSNGTSPGNVRLYSIPIVLTNVQNIIDVSALFPNFASLPSVATEAQLPAINAAPFNTFLVNTLSKTNASSIAVSNGITFIELYGILNTSDSAVVIPNLASFFFVEGTAICWNGTTLVPWDPSVAANVFIGIVGQNDLVYRNGVFTISVGTPYVEGSAYYVGIGINAGVLTTAPPLASNVFLQIGFALSTNSILINAQCSEQLFQLNQDVDNIVQLFEDFNSPATPYTVQLSDNAKIINVNGGTVTLPLPSSLSEGFQVLIRNMSSTGTPTTINMGGGTLIPMSGNPITTSFSLPNTNGTQADFVWLSFNGTTWQITGGSPVILNAANVSGNINQSFSAQQLNLSGGIEFNQVQLGIEWSNGSEISQDGSGDIVVRPGGTGGPSSVFTPGGVFVSPASIQSNNGIFSSGTGSTLFLLSNVATESINNEFSALIQHFCAPATNNLSAAITLGQMQLDPTNPGFVLIPTNVFVNFIVQWGFGSIGQNGSASGNFPITFPNFATIVGSPTVSLGGTNNSLGIQADNNSVWQAEFPSTAGGCNFIWIAVGF
jgi:Phage tail-collar fibre protein